MAYLYEQFEKLAKETERSLGDKVALGAGATAGAGLGAGAVGLRIGNLLHYYAMTRPEYAKQMEPLLATRSGLQRALLASTGAALGAAALPFGLAKHVIDKYRTSPEKGLKRFKVAGKEALGLMKVLHHYTPKKIKGLVALGLPVTAAAGYGGYKGAESLLKD